VHRVGTARPKLLIAADDAASARLLVRVLVQAGYDVEPVLTGKSAISHATATPYDVMICDWTLPDLDGISVVRHVRAQVATQPVILLLSSLNGQGPRQQALRAGADDFITKPYEPLQLLDALEAAVARRSQVSAAVADATITDFPPPPSAVQSTPAERSQPSLVKQSAAFIENTAAWRGLDRIVETTLCQGTGVELGYERANLCESGENMSSAVFMVNVSHLVEVAAALFVTWNSGAELARIILRDDNPDDVAIREILVELGSNVLGNVKTALRRDGLMFTLGLGQPAGMPLASSFARSFAVSWVGGFSGPGLRITSVFGARSIPKVAMPLRKLKENMVLAEDLLSDSGTMVLPAGTRMTSSTAERLARQFAHRSVQVCIPPNEW